jgi:hypothetical protein
MPTILDKLRGVLRRPQNSAADLGTALADARRAETEAKTAVDKQAEAVKANFLDDAAKRERDRTELERLRLAASDAEAIRGALEERYVAALASDEDARRQVVYAAAQAKANAAAAALSKAYPRLANSMVAMLKDLAEAQLAVTAANAELPTGALPIIDPEMEARGVPGQPREIVSDTEVELWGRFDMLTPVDEQFQSEIYSLDRDGQPSGWGRRAEDLEPCFRLRRFRKVVYREHVNGDYPSPLAAALRLPSPRGGGMLWGNSHLVHDPALSAVLAGASDPGAVLASVAAIEAASDAKPVKAERPLKVEYPSFIEVVPYPKEQPRPDATTRRAATRSGGVVKFGSSPMNLPSRAGRR